MSQSPSLPQLDGASACAISKMLSTANNSVKATNVVVPPSQESDLTRKMLPKSLDLERFRNPIKRTARGGVVTPFPDKLYSMLETIASEGKANIVSWLPHGRAFLVRVPKVFVKEILPTHFKQSKLTSFQRQLNLYGFSRITVGRDAGAYFHPLFLRGYPGLCIGIFRTKVKGTGISRSNSRTSIGSNESDTQSNIVSNQVFDNPSKQYTLTADSKVVAAAAAVVASALCTSAPQDLVNVPSSSLEILRPLVQGIMSKQSKKNGILSNNANKSNSLPSASSKFCDPVKPSNSDVSPMAVISSSAPVVAETPIISKPPTTYVPSPLTRALNYNSKVHSTINPIYMKPLVPNPIFKQSFVPNPLSKKVLPNIIYSNSLKPSTILNNPLKADPSYMSSNTPDSECMADIFDDPIEPVPCCRNPLQSYNHSLKENSVLTSTAQENKIAPPSIFTAKKTDEQEASCPLIVSYNSDKDMDDDFLEMIKWDDADFAHIQ
uniref:HSF-type DNA-binding domain-containing protein n=1 Tax=Corethron hystrix TaxID=216773 RepID=A0A6U5DK71_9STRA|mmetsp:Transcript_12559/g.27760  ORF Transcript_12559/g.27760 Transcript_12559/m.27760 type:complete len:492 (+) Transcript_12559:168-1643(+)|eukprot:CAMPEP_0113306912 /NCGR_PEP_ID=MMETSP0010_2-20120614/5979_1 /TAXON_ID=216773 ORGANISM="Corethron hystrix, Strain 308" /NCGR_SAMPLE_ID=MMETSP0010_2 /ASSEMBLY_ACC=CAM_ASM_000155 /LENGTH=491 /DNA_ID=CAMNT_0000161685 /DNA_START=221 /DNA_END=1696 /DNA_ORIENTATION=+ /assembly_acc=CAM_ASM_000155